MTSRTRSNAAFSSVLDLSTSHKVSRKLELSPNASMYQKRDHYLKFFKDPPNAEELSRRVTHGESIQVNAATRGSSNGAFRLLQFNEACTNCENIFKAVLFLHSHIPEKAHLDDESFQFGFTKDSNSFRELAAELGSVEPSLQNVTPQALVSLYNKVIMERKALSDFLAVAAGFSWTDTRMSDMAQELVSTDKVLRERENRQQAAKNDAKRQLVAEAGAADRQTTMIMLGTLPGRKRRLEEDEEEREEREVDGDGAAADVDQQLRPAVPAASTPRPMSPSPHAQQDPVLTTGVSSIVQPNVIQQRTSRLPNITLTAPVQARRLSSASESTDGDSLPHTAGSTSPGLARPVPRFKKRLTGVETDRVSALVARVKELEAENRLFKMELKRLAQMTQSIMKSISAVDDELLRHKKRNIQSVQEQFALMQGQINISQRYITQIDLDVSDFRKSMRDFDGRITTLENANKLHAFS